jgi:hypothetical protein
MNHDALIPSAPTDFYRDHHTHPDHMFEQHEDHDYSYLASIPRAFERMLKEEDSPRGRTVLTVLYLCVLGLCFVIPVFFYIRMHCDDRHNRRLVESEIAGIAQAMDESQVHHREESRATRRKYREERRARIIQLFSPVRMVRP